MACWDGQYKNSTFIDLLRPRLQIESDQVSTHNCL